MKRFYLLSLFVIFALSAIAQQDILTNKAIIEMSEMGFSDEIIISKIDECPNTFDTSIDALKDLKLHKVSEAVIVSMVTAAKKNKVSAINSEAMKEGIFYLDSNGNEQEILPTVFSGVKTNRKTFKKDNTEAILPYKESKNVINNTNPEFVFYFNKSNSQSNFNAGVENWLFKIASNPNEFVLLRMDKKKNERIIQIGLQGSVWDNSRAIYPGVDGKKIIPFKITRISESKYKVILESPLDINNDYCFFYQGVLPKGGNNQSVFDFTIHQ